MSAKKSEQGNRVAEELEALRSKQLAKDGRSKLKDCKYYFIIESFYRYACSNFLIIELEPQSLFSTDDTRASASILGRNERSSKST
jgi:hypothetical protein